MSFSSYKQEVHNLLGSKKDIEALAQKDHARILIISDSHGHPSIFEKIVRQFGSSCDALAFCGDGIGDLAQILYAASTDGSLKKCLPPVIAFAQGNGDPSTYPLSPVCSIKVPNTQILTVNNQNIMIVHGHREGIDFGFDMLGLEMQIADCNTAFYGHTHIAYEETVGGVKFVNPGSCARPRGGQPGGCAIATVEKTFIDIAFLRIDRGDSGETVFNLWNPTF